MNERPGPTGEDFRHYNEDDDPLLSPGYYQESATMRDFRLMGSGDRACFRHPTKEQKAQTHSLYLTDSFAFSEDHTIFGRAIREGITDYVCLKITKGYLVKSFAAEKTPFQVRIKGTDYSFSLREKETELLKPLSKIEAAKKALEQFLRDGR